MHRTDIPRSIIDDGQPLRAGDAFEIDMRTGRSRRVSPDEMPREVREAIRNIIDSVDRDEVECEACGGPCRGFEVPGGDPLAHFQKVCEVANLPMPETVGEVLEIIQILETGDRLRDADRIVRQRALEVDQQLREAYDAGAARARGEEPQREGFLRRAFRRTNGPGEPAPKVSQQYEGFTLVVTTPDEKQHQFWSQSIGGGIDLMAAHLREHLSEQTEGFLVNVIPGRIDR